MLTDRPSFAQELIHPHHHDRVAIVADDRPTTYGRLARLVDARRREIGLAHRSVVILTGPPSLDWIVTYLALIESGHVPLLAGDHVDRLVEAWSPGAVIAADRNGSRIDRFDDADAPPDLHPDLALLLSTSGSTGDPKLVRLSHDNLASNARAIADYLQLGPDDCGITSLPLHYCYGLSVLHSHLVVGASMVVTDASVVDPCFRRALDRHGVTNVAGVPHTFSLLERVGAEQLHVPSLRFVTQAGGKLDRDSVERWLDRTGAWGVDFIVMYGQTEATARMAYLPPSLARRHPGAIGRAIPGGHLELAPIDGGASPLLGRPSDGNEVGELVYRGPNVMLGYATTPDDLSQGRTIDEIRTGDLARFHPDDGVFEIVGRRARFVKPFGLRIDLDALERDLNAALLSRGHEPVAVAGDDDGIAVAAPGFDAESIRNDVADRTGLPIANIAISPAEAVPRTTSDKIDYGAVLSSARAPTSGAGGPNGAAEGAAPPETPATIFATVLGRDGISDDDTFVALGGDSLSYIECSIRLEAALGRVPVDWHLTPVGELTAEEGHRVHRIDTTVVLRAIGICAVVATHMHLVFFPGGAHLLLAVVGFNLSRFMMPIAGTTARLSAGLRTAARAAVPTITWIAIGAAVGATQGLGTLLLINNYVGPRSHSGDHWHFWFIEVFVHLVIATTLLLAIPAVRRADHRYPYALPLAVFGILLLLRLEWAQMGDWYNLRYRTHGVAWFFALGWLVHRSVSTRTRLFTSMLCVATIPGFFGYAQREWFITVCLLVLVWCRDVWFPRRAIRPVAALAAASMWIYISHFTLWPPLVDLLGIELAYLPTILGGVAVWALAHRLRPILSDAIRSPRSVAHRPSLVRIT